MDFLKASPLPNLLPLIASEDFNISHPGSLSARELQMFAAVDSGHLGALRRALELGADPRAQNAQGLCPAAMCIHRGHIDCLLELGARGANMQARDPRGVGAAAACVLAKRLDALVQVLDWGADANARNLQGATPASVAATRGFIDALQILDERGANFDSVDEAGWTLAMLASDFGGPHCEAFLNARAERLEISGATARATVKAAKRM